MRTIAPQVETQRQATEARLSKAEAAAQEAAERSVDRGALLDLANQIESLRGEIARMRGQREVIANQADTADLIALPGIGSKLAARIVLFREKLGGFYRVEQIAETFGLPDSVFQRIRPLLKTETVRLRKLNINTATEEELKSHPYLRWKIARLIIAYRNEHGPFPSVEALRNIMAIDEALLEKVRPYLEI